jgi:hypothetical protein
MNKLVVTTLGECYVLCLIVSLISSSPSPSSSIIILILTFLSLPLSLSLSSPLPFPSLSSASLPFALCSQPHHYHLHYFHLHYIMFTTSPLSSALYYVHHLTYLRIALPRVRHAHTAPGDGLCLSNPQDSQVDRKFEFFFVFVRHIHAHTLYRAHTHAHCTLIPFIMLCPLLLLNTTFTLIRILTRSLLYIYYYF